MPSFLHTKYYRYLEHVGINEDYDDGYRTRDEYDEWLKKDPIKVQREKLIKKGITEEEVAKMEEDIDKGVELSIKKAKSGKLSNISVFLEEVFYERN
jgi:pyruvate dehydrogenase E1 component alpha subunit